MLITKSFRFRLEPNAHQRLVFARFAGCCRFVFNHGLAARIAQHDAKKETLSYAEQCKVLTQLKRTEETAWLKNAHSQVLQGALEDLDRAYRHFFRRLKGGQTPGFPRFKKKGRQDSFRYPQGVKVAGGRIYLPKIDWVRYRDSRPVEGRILQATIKREGEHWFVSLACEIQYPDPCPVEEDKVRSVGIDLGIKKFAVMSDGTEIDNPRHLEKALKKFKRAQRRLRRKSTGSNNWKKQMAKVVKLHVKVKNSRRDFAQKVSTAIVKNHDVIAVEDLGIKNMVKNRHLSRAISDAGWGIFLTMLQYKAEWTGKRLIQIGRFEATSQTCSNCGEKKPMPLPVRIYQCGGCGMVMDRDWNASLNIRAAGLAVLHACGGA